MAVSVVSFLFSRTAQPEAQKPSSLLDDSFLYCILSATSLGPKSSGPQGPPPPGFLYHIFLLTRLISNSDFLSWLSYIIVQRPPNRPLNLWNGMFDRHQAEITVMQLRCHSLPVYQSVAAQWDLYLVPYYQPSSPLRFLSINGHWDVSLPLSLECHVCPGRSKYNTFYAYCYFEILKRSKAWII